MNYVLIIFRPLKVFFLIESLRVSFTDCNANKWAAFLPAHNRIPSPENKRLKEDFNVK